MDQVEDWTLAGSLFRLEAFNGFGSRAKGIHTPYLWSFSNHYTKGKFVADGVFDANAVSQQCGAALLLRRMVDQQAFTFPADVPASTADEIKTAGAQVQFSNTNKTVAATRLQKLLNRFPGISIKLTPDGVPGGHTSDAFKEVTGSFLCRRSALVKARFAAIGQTTQRHLRRSLQPIVRGIFCRSINHMQRVGVSRFWRSVFAAEVWQQAVQNDHSSLLHFQRLQFIFRPGCVVDYFEARAAAVRPA